MKKSVLTFIGLNLVVLNANVLLAQDSSGPLFEQTSLQNNVVKSAEKVQAVDAEQVVVSDQPQITPESATSMQNVEPTNVKPKNEIIPTEGIVANNSTKEKAQEIIDQESKQNVEDLKVAEPKKVEVTVNREEEQVEKRQIDSSPKKELNNKTHIIKEEVYVVKEVNKNNEHKAIENRPASITESKVDKPVRGLKIEGGYVNTRWSRIDPNLKNGSVIGGFNYEFGIGKRFDLAVGFNGNIPRENKAHVENIRLIDSRIDSIFKFELTDHFSFLSGFGFSVTDYNIMKLADVSGTQYVFNKYASGTAFGVSPFMGFRFKLSNDLSIDLNARYFWYYSKLNKEMGGIAVVPAIMFGF